MSGGPGLRSLRVWGRRAMMTVFWLVVLIVTAVAMNLIGIRVVGDAEAWQQWLRGHAAYFLAWRVCLYGGIAYGWWRVRGHVIRRSNAGARARIVRAEVAAVVVLALLEGAQLLTQGGEAQP